jgi:hypothetical protein
MAARIMKLHANASRSGLEGMRASATLAIWSPRCTRRARVSNTVARFNAPPTPCQRRDRRADWQQADGASTRRRPGDEARGTDVLRAFFVDRRAGERMKPCNRVDAGATGMKAPSLDAADNERPQVARHRVRRVHQYALVGLPLRHRRLAPEAEQPYPPSTRGPSA